MFLILLTALQFKNVLEKNGLLCGLFISLYGMFRFFIEFVREPDAHIGLLYLNFTMGQLLCLPMLILGLFFIINSYKRFF